MGSVDGLANRRVLLAVAAPEEAKAVLAGVSGSTGVAEPPAAWRLIELDARTDLVITGIGKANAAGAVARVVDYSRHGCVISLGIAGALPVEPGRQRRVGDVVAASASIFADEGLQTPDGFVGCGALGFPLGPPPVVDSEIPAGPLVQRILARLTSTVCRIATVSTCSGTDALACQVAARTGAAAEAMEGAAVGLVASRLGVEAGELRVISNTAGDRPRQVWDLPRAFSTLAAVATQLRDVLAG